MLEPAPPEWSDAAAESSARRKFLCWMAAACVAAALLAASIVWYGQTQPRRWGHFMAGDPNVGARLFFQNKSCAYCHAVAGRGGKLAPDLGYRGELQSGVSQLVSAMWNHAPRMWERMRTEKVPYPSLSYEDMAHIFAFLYTAGYIDPPGDPGQGRRLFETKGCVRCHAVAGEGGKEGPDLSTLSGVGTPIRLTQAMWNHAPAMELGARRLKLTWPKFQGREMADLMAYLRSASNSRRTDSELLPASPERGWKAFQAKSCVQCHSVGGKGGKHGPPLGNSRKLPLSVVQFAGEMWNHSPEMWQALQTQSLKRPMFEGQEIADVVAFLSSLRYFEPGGSPLIGQTLFSERRCDYCHGKQAEGTGRAPRLRGGPEVTTTITLATALWAHGPQMLDRARQQGRPWPTLTEDDVGDLIAFLNSPFEWRRR